MKKVGELASGDDYDSDDDFTNKRVTEKQKDNLWNFMKANYKKYTKWSLFGAYAAFQGGRRATLTYSRRFEVCIVPHIHLASGSMRRKLKVCREYKVRLSEESLKEFRKYADLLLNSEGILVDFQMKDVPDAEEEPDGDDEAEEPTDADAEVAGPSTRPKRTTRRRMPDMTGWHDFKMSEQDDLLPGPSSPPKRRRGRPPKASSEKKPPVLRGRRGVKREHDEDLIVDAVKPGTGIPNRDMIIVVPKEEELVDNGGNFVMDQEFHHGDNGMEERLMVEMGTLKNQMSAELKEQLSDMQGFMKMEIDSLKKDNNTLVKTVASLQRTMNARPHESEDVDTVPNKKECLLKLKDFVHSLNSPEIEGIKQRIDIAIQDIPDDNEDPMPTRKIAVALDSMLLMMDQ